MKKTKGRMRGILSLVLAMLLMVTMIPAQKVLAEGEPSGSTGNLTFASFDSTDIQISNDITFSNIHLSVFSYFQVFRQT